MLHPYNLFLYRLNAVAWCWPISFCPAIGEMAPSTCVALTLRIIARARGGGTGGDPFHDDMVVQDGLGLSRFGLLTPCQPSTLNGYTPRSSLQALQTSRVVGGLAGGFQVAISASTSFLPSTDQQAAPTALNTNEARVPFLNFIAR